MDKKKHYFYALKLPDEVKLHLHDICKQLKDDFHFNRWVHYEDFHITFAFLGSAEKDQLDTSLDLMEKAIQHEHSFPLIIDHIGIFGKSDSPRIFWAGTKEENRLAEVRKKVFNACTKAGFKLETRPFHPHITLARKWSSTEPFSKDLLEMNHPFISEPLNFSAKEVVLYETHLDRVPKYEVKASFLLN